jgi:hypothetical protein
MHRKEQQQYGRIAVGGTTTAGATGSPREGVCLEKQDRRWRIAIPQPTLSKELCSITRLSLQLDELLNC